MRSGRSSVAQSTDTHSPVKKAVKQVKQWKEVAASVRELAALGQMTENMAQDLGLSPAELRALVGKGTNAAKQLTCLLEALRINIQTIAEQEPLVLRDLQRVCTLCDHKRKCDRDIAGGALATHYQSYCPNADTVRAVKLEPKFSAANSTRMSK